MTGCPSVCGPSALEQLSLVTCDDPHDNAGMAPPLMTPGQPLPRLDIILLLTAFITLLLLVFLTLPP